MKPGFAETYARDRVIGASLQVTVDGPLTVGIVVDWIDHEDGNVTLIVESES